MELAHDPSESSAEGPRGCDRASDSEVWRGVAGGERGPSGGERRWFVPPPTAFWPPSPRTPRHGRSPCSCGPC
eukprot:5410285-Pyramimonas_sp.AAC.1